MSNPDWKSAGLAYVLLIFLGSFGAHWYYLRRPIAGTVMLLMMLVVLVGSGMGAAELAAGQERSGFYYFSGLCALILFIWWLTGFFTIPGRVRRLNQAALA